MEAVLRTVNVLAELERCGARFEFVGGDELKCRCPFHDDHSPSCSINVEKKVYKCHAANCPNDHGDFITFLAGLLKQPRKVIVYELSERYGVKTRKTISSEFVERCHAAIWRAEPLLRELRRRGIGDDDIRRWRLGAREGRVSIPVSDATGAYVNIRYYLPGAPGSQKMRNSSGCGRNVLYPVDQLKYDRVVVCGGEIKALAVASRLNERGYGAVSTTGGEGSWDPEFTAALRGKSVWVMMDIDAAGQVAADRVAAQVARAVASVRVVDLPLDRDQFPTGDVNDWIGRAGATADDLEKLLEASPEWRPRAEEKTESEALEVPLRSIALAAYVGRRIRTRAVVTAIDVAPYVVPKDVLCSCDRSQEGCATCPIYAQEPDPDRGGTMATVPDDSPALLEMVGATKKELGEAIRRGLRIPPCKAVTFVARSWYNVEDVRLSPHLEITEDAAERSMYPAYCVGHGLESNASYELVGASYPHPSNQQSVLLASKATPVRDSLSEYEPTDEALARLEVFRPLRWDPDSIERKLDDLYADLAANVTHIYERRDLHLVVDLAYHSPLVIDFNGQRCKGWVEVLVVGDSSQGKTETTTSLMRHYGLGEKADCKNASVAGLLGGLQQVGTRWFITWGVIPTHDRRLVVLEELKGASVETLSRLTDMRSSGVAEIPKIEKRRTHARTRLVCLSNPRSGRPISGFNFGIEAVGELIGNPEDVRRFDLVLVVTSTQVAPGVLNAAERPRVEHRYDAERCRGLVLWAWTRRLDQVVFEPDATRTILAAATELSQRYSQSLPLLDGGGSRFKLARLAASLACRTFSCDDTRRRVVVRRAHVEVVISTIRRLYDSPECGFDDYTAATTRAVELLEPDLLRNKISATPFPRDVVEQLLQTTDIELRDICDWCGWDREDGIELLSLLVRKHALVRERGGYRKTSAFIELLKRMKNDGLPDRPSYVEEM